MKARPEYIPEKSDAEVLALLKRNLFGINEPIEINDLQDLIKASKDQAVAPIVLNELEKIFPEKKPEFKNLINKTLINNILVHSYHTELDRMMTSAGIPYIALKGAASSFYYPDPAMRSMGDVDFLVSGDDIAGATEVLEREGFKKLDMNHICHIVFHNGRKRFEMHFEPAGVPDGKSGEKIRDYMKSAIAGAERVSTGYSEFYNPDKFHHGLIMLLHMQHHLLSEGIGLRHLCDWAVFVNSMSDAEFRSVFEEKLKAVGLYSFARTISLSASMGIGLPYREFMGEDRALAGEVLADIISGGNFGKKNGLRSDEGMFISDRGKDGVSRNRLLQFIKNINKVIYTKWSFTEKYKILLPFFFVYLGTVRLIRQLIGKRKTYHFISAYKGSKNRKKLYSKLRLFDI